MARNVSSGISVFEYLMQSGQLPHEIDPKSPVSSLLAWSTYWKEALFDRAAGGILRMHVDSFFMSLIASGMIKMTMQNNALQWIIAREYNTTANSIIESCLGCPIRQRQPCQKMNLQTQQQIPCCKTESHHHVIYSNPELHLSETLLPF
jgi:hypothetical protein